MTNSCNLSPGTPQKITLESIALSMASSSRFAPTPRTFASDTHVPPLLSPGEVRARDLSRRQELHDILTAALAVIDDDSSDFSD
jgi:hypothetical protein